MFQARSDDTDIDAAKREKDIAGQLEEAKTELKKMRKGK